MDANAKCCDFPDTAREEPGSYGRGKLVCMASRRWSEIATAVGRAFRAIGYFPADVAAIAKSDPALALAGERPLGGRIALHLEAPLYASFWAMALYRVAHFLHAVRLPLLPRLLSQVARLLTGIEIHPGARIGKGMFIDHGSGVVIGSTAIVGRDARLFHGVTLGGVDGRPGRRHPLLGDGVIVGCGAKVLGPVTIGDGAKVGANSVVLADVPPRATAVGAPARVLERKLERAG